MSDDVDVIATQTSDPDVIQPIPVHASPIEAASPEFGVFQQWKTIALAQRILPRSAKRSSAVIMCVSVTGGALALIGTAAQVQAGIGFRLGAGQSVTFHAQSEVWVAPSIAGQTVDVDTLDERYR